jgi:hypothetical protein
MCEAEEARDRPFVVAMVSGACIGDVFTLMAWCYVNEHAVRGGRGSAGYHLAVQPTELSGVVAR